MTNINNQISKQWKIPSDLYLQSIKDQWFNQSHPIIRVNQAIPILNEWFRSSRLNNLIGWDSLPCVDITMGCSHYIESFIIGQQSLDKFQVLHDEYAYYSFLGKWGNDLGSLESNKPLIITLPHYKWADLRPEWEDVLKECEQKNIDIHIDMAWLTLSRDISIDFSHPCIKSVGMSMSKYDLQWNRVGLRYSRQRKMDSVTIFNHFYAQHVNENLYSCAVFCANQIPRDYLWTKYANEYYSLCANLNLEPTKLIHGAKLNDSVYCITDALFPHTK